MASTGRSADSANRDTALRLRRTRLALGLTQRDWAYYLRVAVNTVSAWENGHTRPSGLAEAQIRNVAVGLGLDLHTLGPFR